MLDIHCFGNTDIPLLESNCSMIGVTPRKLKILYFIDGLGRGGTELQLTGLISRLDRNRFEPYLCTLLPTASEFIPSQCGHYALDVPRIFGMNGITQMGRMAKEVKRKGIEIVQTFFQDSTVFGGIVARMAGVPVRLASFRDLGFWRTPSREFLLRMIHRNMNGFLANSQAVKEHFMIRDGIPPDRIHIVPNGVDTASWPFVERSGPVRNIAFLGNINRRVKRTDVFLRAAALLAEGYPDITWHIIGDGQYRSRLDALVSELAIGERVVFAGRVEDVPRYLAAMDIGVNCSDSEGFSNAILEYMLSGCPVVATAVGGNTEVVAHGVTGVLVPPGDPESLAGGIRELIGNPILRGQVAKKARAVVEKRFNWDICVRTHEEFYWNSWRDSRGIRG